jgi:glycerol-3-phosphate dehydrogenase
MTVVGTTDSPAGITMEPVALETDVRFIVDEANRYLNRRVRARLCGAGNGRLPCP